MVLFKIFGGLIFVLGLLIFIFFPSFGINAFQSPETAKAGLVVGAILMAVGFAMAYFS